MQRREIKLDSFLKLAGTWLGFVIHTVSIPKVLVKKREKLNSLLSVAVGDSCICPAISEDHWLCYTAIASMQLGPFTAFSSAKCLYNRVKMLRVGANLPLSPLLLEELRFWPCNLDPFDDYSIRTPLLTSTVVIIDASSFAFGYFFRLSR